MDDNPDYVTLQRHATLQQFVVCLMAFNRADDSYGIRHCIGPLRPLVAYEQGAALAKERGIEFRPGASHAPR